jgi:tetratricopeptide (TPR) repeat protein
MREYLSTLKKEFYNDDKDYNHHVKLYEEKQDEIELWFSDDDSYVALLAYKLAIIKYAVGLIKMGRYKDAEAYLLKIEPKFRAYSHSDDKQKLLEFFQYYLAYSHYTTGNFYRARDAFNKLLQCKPENGAYKEAWKENERKIAKRIANMTMLIGLILSIVGWYGDMNYDLSIMRFVLYAGIAVIASGGIYTYFRNIKLR